MKKHLVSGKINVGCLFIIIILVAGGYVSFKFGRIYLAKYLFNRRLYELTGNIAKDYALRTYPNNLDVANAIIKEADKFSVDLNPDNIRVIRRDDQLVIIHVTWEGEVVLPKYTHYFVFEFEAKREVVY